MTKGEILVKPLIYYSWQLVILQLNCNHTKMVHAENSSHIKIDLYLQHNLAKVVRQLHMGSLQRPCIWDGNVCAG